MSDEKVYILDPSKFAKAGSRPDYEAVWFDEAEQEVPRALIDQLKMLETRAVAADRRGLQQEAERAKAERARLREDIENMRFSVKQQQYLEAGRRAGKSNLVERSGRLLDESRQFCTHGRSINDRCEQCVRELDVRTFANCARLPFEAAEIVWRRYSRTMGAEWLAVPPSMTIEGATAIVQQVQENLTREQLFAIGVENRKARAAARPAGGADYYAALRYVNQGLGPFKNPIQQQDAMKPRPASESPVTPPLNAARGYFDE